MTLKELKDQILNGITAYEDVHLTRSALDVLVDNTADALYNMGYVDGLADAVVDVDDVSGDVEFTSEIEFDDFEDEDGDLL